MFESENSGKTYPNGSAAEVDLELVRERVFRDGETGLLKGFRLRETIGFAICFLTILSKNFLIIGGWWLNIYS